MLNYLHSLEQLLEAIAHVHAHPAVHGDIKLDNFLVSAEGVPVLSDFELSRNFAGGGGGERGAVGAAASGLASPSGRVTGGSPRRKRAPPTADPVGLASPTRTRRGAGTEM